MDVSKAGGLLLKDELAEVGALCVDVAAGCKQLGHLDLEPAKILCS